MLSKLPFVLEILVEITLAFVVPLNLMLRQSRSVKKTQICVRLTMVQRNVIRSCKSGDIISASAVGWFDSAYCVDIVTWRLWMVHWVVIRMLLSSQFYMSWCSNWILILAYSFSSGDVPELHLQILFICVNMDGNYTIFGTMLCELTAHVFRTFRIT